MLILGEASNLFKIIKTPPPQLKPSCKFKVIAFPATTSNKAISSFTQFTGRTPDQKLSQPATAMRGAKSNDQAAENIHPVLRTSMPPKRKKYTQVIDEVKEGHALKILSKPIIVRDSDATTQNISWNYKMYIAFTF